MTEFRCMTPNCKQSLCENCAPAPDIKNKVFCRLCRLMASNIDLMQWEDDEDEIASFISGGKFQKQASVKFDREANLVHGFEGIMAALDMKEEEKADAMSALMSDMNKYVTNKRHQNQDRAKWKTMVDADLANLSGYLVEQIDDTNFILKHE